MKMVTFTCQIQYDSYDKRPGSKHDVARAVEAINLVLQREPYGLAAQVIFDPNDTEINVNPEQFE
jgi:hypothetical protein